MSLHRDNLSVLYNWSSEMKDTFLASAEATDYLKNDESWTRMRRLFDIMDLRMAYGAGIVCSDLSACTIDQRSSFRLLW